MRVSAIAIGLLILCCSVRVEAYSEQTHSVINEEAADHPALIGVLRDQLGFLQDLDETVGHSGVLATLLEWIGEGGFREDDGGLLSGRFYRHFHDPLQPWAQAGLSLLGIQFESAILWMLRPDQTADVPEHGEWGWPTIRRHYLTALTTPDPAARERAWADAFRGLGHLMHVVVDTGQAEHARDSVHLSYGPLFGFYEFWVEQQQGTTEFNGWLSNPMGYPPALLAGPGHNPDPAPHLPVARLIDANLYAPVGDAQGPWEWNVNATWQPGALVGLAEYANANFFTTSTADPGNPYPHPDPDKLLASTHPVPPAGFIKKFYRKHPEDGEPYDPALAECLLDQAASDDGVPRTMRCTRDPLIWRHMAQRLIPRTVGYARGVLDYFFRGRLEVAAPDRYVYGRARHEPAAAADGFGRFTELRARVRNVSAVAGVPEAIPAGGVLRAVLHYRRLELPGFGPLDSFAFPALPLSPGVHAAVSQPVALAEPLTDAFQEFSFAFEPGLALPVNAVDVRLFIVYTGPLGLEAEAVAVGTKDLLEPDPVDFVNTSDWECVAPTFGLPPPPPFYVADLATYLPYPPGGYEPSRDVNQDGVVDLLGPVVEEGVRLRIGPLAVPSPPLDGAFDLALPELPFGGLGRVVILQDQPSYRVTFTSGGLLEVPTARQFGGRQGAFGFGGIRNDRILHPQSGAPVHRVTASNAFRGSAGFRRIVLASGPTLQCLSALRDLPPALTLVPAPPAEIPGTQP